MLSNPRLGKSFLYKSMLILGVTLLVSACENKVNDSKVTSESNEVKASEVLKSEIKPDCLPPTGSVMEDGEVHVCTYKADSLEQAYASIVKESAASSDGSGYGLLKKFLPSNDVEDKFDEKQTWIKYVWLDKAHVTVTIQMAGGEDTLEFAKENGNVKVTTTLSAD